MATSARPKSHPKEAAIAARVKHQIRQFLIMFLYLWVLLTLFVLNDRLTLNQHGLTLAFNGFALLNALVLAKVMLLMEDLHLARWLENRPLIYPIIYESALLSVLFLVFHVVERLAVGWWHGKTLAESMPLVNGGGMSGRHHRRRHPVHLAPALLRLQAFERSDRPGAGEDAPLPRPAGLRALRQARASVMKRQQAMNSA